MSKAASVVVCAGGAPWETVLVRALQRPELGVHVAHRCSDHGDLLGTALRDHPRAVLVDADLSWVDLDFVAMMRREGIEVVVIGEGRRQLGDLGVPTFPSDVPVETLAAGIHRTGTRSSADDLDAQMAAETEMSTGRVVAIWSGVGSPGRTTVAVHLALEAAALGFSTLLIDADVWGASIAQTLGLDESPSLTQAARLAGDGWPQSLSTCVQRGPLDVGVLAGLARSELWPEVREEAWRAVIGAARQLFDVVVLDLAAPIEEDEDLVYDRIPYRRNLVTTIGLELADVIVQVAAADPIGLRRGVVANRTLASSRRITSFSARLVLNRAPGAGRRLQDCSRAVSEWMGVAPTAILPDEPALVRSLWEGRPLHDIAPRSRWLRELRTMTSELVA